MMRKKIVRLLIKLLKMKSTLGWRLRGRRRAIIYTSLGTLRQRDPKHRMGMEGHSNRIIII
jgi:hypothetical protein